MEIDLPDPARIDDLETTLRYSVDHALDEVILDLVEADADGEFLTYVDDATVMVLCGDGQPSDIGRLLSPHGAAVGTHCDRLLERLETYVRWRFGAPLGSLEA